MLWSKSVCIHEKFFLMMDGWIPFVFIGIYFTLDDRRMVESAIAWGELEMG